MSQAKSPTREGTISGSTAAPHLSTPRPESTVQWPDWAMLEPSTPNAPAKGGETIEDMFKRLPPHGKPDCATHLWKHETIDEAISRIATSEGLYKLYWILSQKAQNADRGTDHKEMLTKKARAAVNKAMHLLAIELNLEKGTLEHTIANAVAERRTRATMQSEV